MTDLPMTDTRRPSHFARIISLLRTGPRPLVLRFYDQFSRLRTGAPVWHLSEITPQVYIGGQHYRRGWTAMQAHGITAVVNLREAHHDDAASGIQGAHHLHLVTRDNTPPAIEDLQRGAAFIAGQVDDGGQVYVHCGVGVGRAPTMAAAYLISTGMSPDEAMARIKTVRPFVHLTPAQRRQLDAFAASLH